jgi:hypothetical protein
MILQGLVDGAEEQVVKLLTTDWLVTDVAAPPSNVKGVCCVLLL